MQCVCASACFTIGQSSFPVSNYKYVSYDGLVFRFVFMMVLAVSSLTTKTTVCMCMCVCVLKHNIDNLFIGLFFPVVLLFGIGHVNEKWGC